ncbi:MAG: hypothetical protein ACTHOO_04135 [Alcanivorax sp.]
MRSFLSFGTICVATFALTACAGKPNPFPRGYASYGQPYKSAPGPKTKDIGYSYSNQKNATALKDMRYAAEDLVEKLDQKLSFSVDEIYLKISENSAFYTSFDHLVREELTERGYLLTNTPVNAVTLDFVAVDTVPECYASNAEGGYQNVYLALAINVSKNTPQDVVGGFYEVPLYDFKSVNMPGLTVPSCHMSVDQSEEG